MSPKQPDTEILCLFRNAEPKLRNVVCPEPDKASLASESSCGTCSNCLLRASASEQSKQGTWGPLRTLSEILRR